MTAKDVIEIVNLLNQNDIEVIIDGGWGVDALLEKQTRTHADLDVAGGAQGCAKYTSLAGSERLSRSPLGRHMGMQLCFGRRFRTFIRCPFLHV